MSPRATTANGRKALEDRRASALPTSRWARSCAPRSNAPDGATPHCCGPAGRESLHQGEDSAGAGTSRARPVTTRPGTNEAHPVARREQGRRGRCFVEEDGVRRPPQCQPPGGARRWTPGEVRGDHSPTGGDREPVASRAAAGAARGPGPPGRESLAEAKAGDGVEGGRVPGHDVLDGEPAARPPREVLPVVPVADLVEPAGWARRPGSPPRRPGQLGRTAAGARQRARRDRPQPGPCGPRPDASAANSGSGVRARRHPTRGPAAPDRRFAELGQHCRPRRSRGSRERRELAPGLRQRRRRPAETGGRARSVAVDTERPGARPSAAITGPACGRLPRRVQHRRGGARGTSRPRAPKARSTKPSGTVGNPAVLPGGRAPRASVKPGRGGHPGGDRRAAAACSRRPRAGCRAPRAASRSGLAPAPGQAASGGPLVGHLLLLVRRCHVHRATAEPARSR